jgi:hypothetical protein
MFNQKLDSNFQSEQNMNNYIMPRGDAIISLIVTSRQNKIEIITSCPGEILLFLWGEQLSMGLRYYHPWVDFRDTPLCGPTG